MLVAVKARAPVDLVQSLRLYVRVVPARPHHEKKRARDGDTGSVTSIVRHPRPGELNGKGRSWLFGSNHAHGESDVMNPTSSFVHNRTRFILRYISVSAGTCRSSSR
jgi:hypothetical protein